jgi:hypothetical protein
MSFINFIFFSEKPNHQTSSQVQKPYISYSGSKQNKFHKAEFSGNEKNSHGTMAES